MSRTDSTIAHLDQARDWLTTHALPADGLDTNTTVRINAHDVQMYVHTYSAEAMREARRIIGPMTKEEVDGGFVLRAEIDGIRFVLFPPAGICKRVKVGTKVEQTTKEVCPAETVTVEEEVDVYEWECGGVLVSDGRERRATDNLSFAVGAHAEARTA